jgi:hypothetical protein
MQDIHAYIKAEQNRYQIMPVPIVEGYAWNMFEHVRLTTLYLNSQYKTGQEDDKPFRNIILPKVNLEHRAVEFDLDEIQFYIDSDQNYKSFLVKKFHERWALKNDIADFLDKLSETYTDYGGVLVKNTNDALEVVPFQRLAFCDQTDMTSGPICEQHEYSPDQLLAMAAKGWGDFKYGATGTLQEVIALAKEEKTNTQSMGGGGFITTVPKAQTPGRYIEVFELHGMLQETYLDPDGDENIFVRQMQIVTSYIPKEGRERKGIVLFAGKEKESLYKAFRRDEVYGRALGRGAVEELFEPQVWVNSNEIAKHQMLTQASKIIYQTADQTFKSRNGTADLENGDVLTYADGKPLAPLNTAAPNVQAFEDAAETWDNQAQQIAAANDLIAGEQPNSNTTGQAQMLQNQEAHSLHEYRKGRLSIFLTEVYRDWVIPKVQKAVAGGDKFLSNLSSDEMGQLVDQIVAHEFNKTIIAKVLSGQIVYPDDAQTLLQSYRKQFFTSGNKKLITILEGELSDLPLQVEVNITDKQRNMQLMTQKFSAILTQAFNILSVQPNFFTDHPEMAKLFNEIIESYGLSSLTFGINGNLPAPKTAQQQPQQQQQTQNQYPQLNQPQYANTQIQDQPQASGQNIQ